MFTSFSGSLVSRISGAVQPVETDEEFHTLATSLSQKLEMMVAKAEADERDLV
ncbi:DUF1382 family protein [Escherichia coli]|uniref:DUF1382 family protein n=1 Tax=Escherichia coli TaxID=562 RepID=UPI0020190CFC|nr:DUF1382 family protein [Escherichia coli]